MKLPFENRQQLGIEYVRCINEICCLKNIQSDGEKTAFSVVDDLDEVIRRSNALLDVLMDIILKQEEGYYPNNEATGVFFAGVQDLKNSIVERNKQDFDVAIDKARKIGTTSRVVTAN